MLMHSPECLPGFRGRPGGSRRRAGRCGHAFLGYAGRTASVMVVRTNAVCSRRQIDRFCVACSRRVVSGFLRPGSQVMVSLRRATLTHWGQAVPGGQRGLMAAGRVMIPGAWAV